MNGTPLEAGKVADIVKGIRKRKGLNEEVRIFYYYIECFLHNH
jgi:elongation factor 2